MAMAGPAGHRMVAHRSAPPSTSLSSSHRNGVSSSTMMSSQSISSGGSRSMHSSSSYATLSSSSSGSSSRRYTPASSSSNTFPSPATSTTSSASSLRTPPDLLLNANALGSTWKPTLQVKDEKPVPRHLEADEITKHLNLITSIVRTSLPRSLPSPPGSPRRVTRRLEPSDRRDGDRDRHSRDGESVSQTRRRDGPRESDREADSEAGSRSSVKRPRRASPSPQRSSPNRPSQSPRNRSPPPRQAWTREHFNEVAAACRHKGRELKHRGDHRLRDASAPQSAHSPQHAAQLAALEQTDAILLYTYGFWCEDQASPKETPCIAANWTTLFGLLKYVYSCHERQGSTVLAGLCRLLEALVLSHLANHELRLVQYRTSKAAASAAANASSPSSRSHEVSAPSPAMTSASGDHPMSGGGSSSGPDPATVLSDLHRSMTKIVADLDRSNRIFGQATSMLSRKALTRSFPETWAACASSDLEAADKGLAESLDPGSLGRTARDDPPQFAWAWPINHLTPFPHTVCFGRALVREASLKLGFSYQPGRIA